MAELSGDCLTGRYRRYGILVLLVASAVLLGLAPLVLPPTYSWVLHTTSESAAQGLPGAWVARMGFVFFGFAVLWLAVLTLPRWGRWGSLMLGGFGVLMLCTAAFSHRPWLPNAPFDPVEDLLHSITATAMGFSFAGGVVAVGVRRLTPTHMDRAFDLLAVGSSVILPLAMAQNTPYTGVLQRAMFLVAYAWYAREAVRGAL